MLDYQYLFSGMSIQEIEEKLRSIVQTALCEKYGDNPSYPIIERIEEEWDAIKRCDLAAETAVLYELTTWLKENKYFHYYMSDNSGSSFIFYLLGITRGNPLPPHQYCPECKKVWWYPAKDGFDLMRNIHSENDGSFLWADGHNLPWQILFGYDNSRLEFEIHLPIELYADLFRAFISHWLYDVKPCDKPWIFCGDKYRSNYIELPNLNLVFCVGYEDSNLPISESESNDTENTVKFSPEEWRYSMLVLWNLLIGCDYDCFEDIGITEPYDLDDNFNSISELIYLCGLLYSKGVWDEETEWMIKAMGYSPSDLIVFSDDVYQYLIEHGYSEETAWLGMDSVRQGKGLPIVTDELRFSCDKWVIARCDKIEHLWSKAQAIERILFRYRFLPCEVGKTPEEPRMYDTEITSFFTNCQEND